VVPDGTLPPSEWPLAVPEELRVVVKGPGNLSSSTSPTQGDNTLKIEIIRLLLISQTMN
jgi:hypothetical protein